MGFGGCGHNYLSVWTVFSIIAGKQKHFYPPLPRLIFHISVYFSFSPIIDSFG